MRTWLIAALLVVLLVVDLSARHRRHHRMCRRGMRMCRSVRRCVARGKFCDGRNDCGDFSDEYRCSGFTCPPNKFHCEDGPCINARWRCDGEADCNDESDEVGCPHSLPH